MSTDSLSTEAVLGRMSLAEKLGQMTQVSNDSITPAEVADHHIGSILSGGNGTPTPNTPEAWRDMVSAFTEARSGTGVPPVYGVDAVHGHAIARGATVFPHNIGLGAAGDPQLVEAIGEATAAEMLATGIRWTFAPAVSVPQDIRWGRTYEGYGRDPGLVSELGAAAIRGLQGVDADARRVLACAKHFVGDGATAWGTAPRLDHVDWWDGWGPGWQIDQGDARVSESELRSVHLAPYRAAIDAGVETVMASYNSWNGEKLHGHRHLLTDVLKGELGFGGFVISDWMGIDQLDASYETSVEQAINAGIDMVMVPEDWRRFLEAITTLVTDGRIPLSRIDDAVHRILGAKRRAGILEGSTPPLPGLEVVGSRAHRALAAEAVRRSAVLLKGSGEPPIPPGTSSITVAGTAADDIGLQCGGWTAGWQGAPGAITDGTTLLAGLGDKNAWEITFDPSGSLDGRHEVTIVCVAEPPYAEGPGDTAVPSPTDEDRALFSRMRERSEHVVLVLYSGRPLVATDLIERADVVVAAWLPGSEAGALADVLAGDHPFGATTPQPWPRSPEDVGSPGATPLFPVGHGSRSAVDPESPTALERAEQP